MKPDFGIHPSQAVTPSPVLSEARQQPRVTAHEVTDAHHVISCNRDSDALRVKLCNFNAQEIAVFLC
jgi:hypothetical protein